MRQPYTPAPRRNSGQRHLQKRRGATTPRGESPHEVEESVRIDLYRDLRLDPVFGFAALAVEEVCDTALPDTTALAVEEVFGVEVELTWWWRWR
jgi:hypothetical protein